MNAGQGSIAFNSRQLPSGAPFAAGSAVNGLSVDALGRIVLGDPLGATGPANFLDNREIDMDDNQLLLTNAHLNLIGSLNGAEVDFSSAFNGSRLFFLDSIAGQYGLGNIDGTILTGLTLGINDLGILDITDAAVRRYLGIDITADPRVFFGRENSATFEYNESGGVAALSALHNIGTGLGIFDTEATFSYGNTKLRIDQIGDTIEMFGTGSSVEGFKMDGMALMVRMGFSAIGNGTQFGVDDSGSTADVSNGASTAAFSVNGNVGVSGSFTAQSGEVVTVEGGIITSII